MTHIDDRIEYFSILQAQSALADTMLVASKTLADLGPESLKVVATNNPEMILAAISGLSMIVNEQRGMINRMAEDYFDLIDTVTKSAKKE